MLDYKKAAREYAEEAIKEYTTKTTRDAETIKNIMIAAFYHGIIARVNDGAAYLDRQKEKFLKNGH